MNTKLGLNWISKKNKTEKGLNYIGFLEKMEILLREWKC